MHQNTFFINHKREVKQRTGFMLRRGRVEDFYLEKMTGRQNSDVMILVLLKSVSTRMSYDGYNMVKRWKLVKT